MYVGWEIYKAAPPQSPWISLAALAPMVGVGFLGVQTIYNVRSTTNAVGIAGSVLQLLVFGPWFVICIFVIGAYLLLAAIGLLRHVQVDADAEAKRQAEWWACDQNKDGPNWKGK